MMLKIKGVKEGIRFMPINYNIRHAYMPDYVAVIDYNKLQEILQKINQTFRD